MVVIRLARWGSRNRPFYSVVVANSTSPRDGKFIEKIGIYCPQTKKVGIICNIDLARLDYWLSVGAQMSETVERLAKKTRLGKITNLTTAKTIKKLVESAPAHDTALAEIAAAPQV